MSVTARRVITLTYSGDVDGEEVINAATNTSSPGQIQVVALAEGDNQIECPEGCSAVTILKPSDNTVQLYIKGTTGRPSGEGFPLHLTDPDSISTPGAADLILEAFGGDVTVRLFWS